MANLIHERVLRVAKIYNYSVHMMHNQRIIGPRAFELVRPEDGCEIFIYNLPRNIFEDELLPFFLRAGTVFKLRLMLSQSGTSNRGFGYVTYTTKNEVIFAIKYLNNSEIHRGSRVHLQKSMDNKRLFVGGIPDHANKQEVMSELKHAGMDNAIDCIMYPSYTDHNMNRGFVFVEFATHQEAAAARNKFRNIFIFEQRVRVDWSTPLHSVPTEVLQKVKRLYIRNLHIDLSKEEFVDIVKRVIGNIAVEKVYKFRNYSFVHFLSRKDAQHAMDLFKEYYKDSMVEVLWAKPAAIKSNGNAISDQNSACSCSMQTLFYDSNCSEISSNSSSLPSTSSSFKDTFAPTLLSSSSSFEESVPTFIPVSAATTNFSTENYKPEPQITPEHVYPFTLSDLITHINHFVNNKKNDFNC